MQENWEQDCAMDSAFDKAEDQWPSRKISLVFHTSDIGDITFLVWYGMTNDADEYRVADDDDLGW